MNSSSIAPKRARTDGQEGNDLLSSEESHRFEINAAKSRILKNLSSLLKDLTEEFKACYSKATKAQASFFKLKDMESKGIVPKSISVKVNLALNPTTCAEELQFYQKMKTDFELKTFQLLIQGREKLMKLAVNECDNFVSKAIAKHEHIITLCHTSGDAALQAFKILLVERIEDAKVSILVVNAINIDKAKEREKLLEEKKATMLQEPTPTIKQVIAETVQQEVKKQKSTFQKGTQNPKAAPKKGSNKGNSSKSTKTKTNPKTTNSMKASKKPKSTAQRTKQNQPSSTPPKQNQSRKSSKKNRAKP